MGEDKPVVGRGSSRRSAMTIDSKRPAVSRRDLVSVKLRCHLQRQIFCTNSSSVTAKKRKRSVFVVNQRPLSCCPHRLSLRAHCLRAQKILLCYCRFLWKDNNIRVAGASASRIKRRRTHVVPLAWFLEEVLLKRRVRTTRNQRGCWCLYWQITQTLNDHLMTSMFHDKEHDTYVQFIEQLWNLTYLYLVFVKMYVSNIVLYLMYNNTTYLDLSRFQCMCSNPNFKLSGTFSTERLL